LGVGLKAGVQDSVGRRGKPGASDCHADAITQRASGSLAMEAAMVL